MGIVELDLVMVRKPRMTVGGWDWRKRLWLHLSGRLSPQDEGARFIAELNGSHFIASDGTVTVCGFSSKDLRLEEGK